MLEVALYIVSGLTLYAGGHHLYLGANRAQKLPHVQLGVLYLLLSGFALASALTFQPGNLDTLLPSGKLAISLGLILWCLLAWHIALRSGYRPWLLLDLLTAGWLAFLLQNLTSANSLIYTEVMPINRTLLNGESFGLLQSQVSPWWTAVELTMLATLAFCAYATYRVYQRKQKTLAYSLGAGLGLLAAVTFYDHLVSSGVLNAHFLAPFGFLGFLLACSSPPVLAGWRRMRNPKPPPMLYNLTFKPDCASFHTDVSQLRTPLWDNDSSETPTEKPAGTVTRAGFPVTEDEDIHDVPSDTLRIVPTSKAPPPVAEKPVTPPPPQPVVDEALLHTVTDNLIDIAVYATMALNRFKRGDADAKTLENICKKVRTSAIKTRRLAGRLSQPKQTGDDDKDKQHD